MRVLTIFAACLSLAGCASAVYDSLDRRGVDSETVFAARAEELRNAAAGGKSAFGAAADALAAVDGLDGQALARQIDKARAAEEDAALAAQDLRLAGDSLSAARGRYFREKEEELRLMKTSAENLRAAQARLASVQEADRAISTALSAANLRMSPALSLYDAEIVALRKNAASGVFAAARSGERAAAVEAAKAARDSLGALAAEADRFLGTLRGPAQ